MRVKYNQYKESCQAVCAVRKRPTRLFAAFGTLFIQRRKNFVNVTTVFLDEFAQSPPKRFPAADTRESEPYHNAVGPRITFEEFFYACAGGDCHKVSIMA